jgi:antitoxin MazE
MVMQINQWGHSLGVRLPKILTERLNLKKGTSVNIYEQNGKIIIEKGKDLSLKELLAHSAQCPYGEIETGDNVGHEEW